MCLFLLSSRHSLSVVSVVFDFNASPNAVFPVSPMLLPVYLKRKEKSELLMDVFCIFILLSSLHRWRSVSVVFDFNDSLNDIVPVYPMLFTVDEKRKEKSELLMDVFCMSSFFCLYFPD